MTSNATRPSTLLRYAGLVYLAFVIYGSLVPLDMRALSLDDAIQAFARITYLNLGIESRADWIANILLYIPLTFMWAAMAAQALRGISKAIALCAVFSVAVALSVGIEFTQLFFPPRTVSLNDILAETIGSATGIVLWLAMGVRVSRWLAALRNRHAAESNTALAAALALYLIAYSAFSLFPFDFVVSSAELAQRLASEQNAWLFSAASCSSSSRCLAGAFVEVLAALPLGVMVVRFGSAIPIPASRVAVAMLMGAALGVFIEGVQLFLHSAVSEGISVLTRSMGAGLGAYVHRRLLLDPTMRSYFIPRRLRLLALWITPLYLLGLIGMQNWHWHDWLNGDAGLARLPQVHFLPFYYHYYTSETAALTSLMRIAASYAPIGMILWLKETSRRNDVLPSAGFAILLAMVLECAKLFQAHLHPDPTNILIAAVAAVAGYTLINWWSALHALPGAFIPSQKSEPEKIEVATFAAPRQPAPLGRINPLALCSAGLLAWAIVRYPLGAYWLAGGALVYFMLLRRWPHAWLLLLPASLPVLDLTPWTGRFFLDEFDCLLLATMAIIGWRKSVIAASYPSSYRLPTAAWLIVALLTLSTVAALLIGSYPYPAWDLNISNPYYSPYNALRVGKGLLWALLLLPFLKAELERNAAKAQQLFSLGMTLGVVAAGLAVLWERLAFTGLLDFKSDYRVVGMFSGMHTGGAYIEAYFATALPFVAWWTVRQQRTAARLFGAVVFALGIYALMVTYARGGYIALALGMATLAVGLLLRNKASFKPTPIVGGFLLLLLLAGVAWPVLHGSYMQERFSTTKRDMHTRVAHWENALQMMDDSVTTTLFGMGLGRYPETYFWRNTEGVHPATFQLMNEPSNTFLALSAGDVLYFEQLVDVEAHQQYRLHFTAKSQTEKAELALPLCEKWMLYSINCTSKTIKIGNTNGQWRRYAVDIDTNNASERRWYAQPTVKLGFVNPVAGTTLAIDNVSMKSENGSELVRNGAFQAGMDHWFFSTDNHLPWHFKNLWLQLYFEQGALGLLIFACLIAYTFIALASRYGDKDAPIPALAAALVGFLTVGVVDSLFDVPRMALLFYLLAAWVFLQKQTRS